MRYSMETRVYRNKWNSNKYIEVKHYGDGHYYWRQFIHCEHIAFFNTPCTPFHRISKRWSSELLESDYKPFCKCGLLKGTSYTFVV